MTSTNRLFVAVSHIALAGFVLASPALAQTAGAPAPASAPAADAAAADEGEMMIVTGYRAAIQSAIDSKRELSVIGEAFSAEDIGKLPDVSIAETLGRLPGLATQRLDGRSQVLSIRGLGPDFSTTLLNGREQVSSSDNRGVEYDQYPSELVTSGVVYKTPFAGLVGQGLAGTVDLRTAKPLDYKERVISVAARGEFNERGSLNPDAANAGYRGTLTYIDQFLDGTLGLSLGVAYQSSPTQIQRFEAWGFPNVSAAQNASQPLVIGGAKPYVRSTMLDRLGVFGTLEYKPSENFHSQFDIFYSDYKENRPSRGIEFPLAWGGGTSLRIDQVENGIVTQGAFSGVSPVVRNDFDRKTTENLALGWRNTYTTGGTTIDLDLNYSKAVRNQQNIESYSGLAYGAGAPRDTITFARQANGVYNFTSPLNYADTSLIRLTDPQGWGGGNNLVQAGFINSPNTKDELKQIRLSVTQELGWGPIAAVEVGANYGDRTKRRIFDQNFLTLAGPTSSLSGGATRTAAIPAAALLDKSTGLFFMGFGPQVTYDPYYLINNGVYTQVSVALSSIAVPQSWFVSEKVTQGWVRFKIDQDIGDTKLTGDFGIQVVHTDQSSTGSRIETGTGGSAGVNNAVFVPVIDGARYTYVLPSLNLNFKLSEQTQLRFGAARTLARARMDQLNASLQPRINLTQLPSTNPNQSAFSAEGGNARLRPYISDGVDISLEHYFGRRGYVSVAGFYKHLSSFVNPASAFLADFSYLTAQLTPAQLAILGTTQGIVSGPTNNGSGNLYGIEATASVPLDILLPALEGFGVQTSASYTKSSIKFPGNAVAITVPGLSDWVVNSTVYYEKSGFEARVSHRFRNDFLAEVSGISATRILRGAKAESIIDAQIGYRFESGRLEGLALTFQALNLTDEPFVTYQGDRANVITHESYGRTYLIGATYRF